MGCVSSKVSTRSRSFRDELSLSLQRRTNGIPVLEDLLANKNGGGDPLLALLCTANTVAVKLKAGGAASEVDKQPSLRTVEPERDEKSTATTTTAPEEPAETINTWELMAGLDEEDEDREQEPEQRPLQLQQPQRKDLEAMVAANSSLLVRRDVEAWLEESHGNPSKDCLPKTTVQNDEQGEQTRNGNADQAAVKADGSGYSGLSEKPELENVDSAAWSRSSSARGSEGNDMAGSRSFVAQKGLRRRAMARELKLLKVPSFEFSSVGSLREWLGGGAQVFSPGSYVTPKFGGFGTQAAAAERGGDAGEEDALFDPELVADLEDAMERLTMEEEHILKEIAESLQRSHEEDKQEQRL